jgi:hypothetical protein
MVRIKAFLIHFSVSLLIALCSVLVVFFIWYPGELSNALGVLQIFMIILIVDVTIGPLLTLIVFNPQKPPSRWRIGKFRWDLRCDITAIALFQLVALAYGVHTVAQSRPLWLVLTGNQFNVVRSVDIEKEHLEKGSPPFNKRSVFGPRWIAALQPEDPAERRDLMLEAFEGKADVHHRPEYYISLDQITKEDWERIVNPLENLYKFNEKEAIEKTLANYPDANGWAPLIATQQDKVVLLGEERTTPLAIVALKPW